MPRIAFPLSLIALALSACSDSGAAREEIRVVGSSTVYPFTTAVAESFNNSRPDMRAPVIESTGTGAGINQFCAGIGPQHPDLLNASRRMTIGEFEQCAANGVTEIMEVQVGADGLAIAQAAQAQPLSLTRAHLYRALAANPMGRPNTARTWADVDPALPAIPITVFGPPSTSGTRDSFNELMMEPGCEAAWPAAAELEGDAYDEACVLIRSDGPYVDAGENDNLIVQKLVADPSAIGIFGFSYLEENASRVRGLPIDGTTPTYETVASGAYPGARPLYIYVKKRHIRAVPGLAAFLEDYAAAWGPDGPLVRRGMIAAPAPVRERSAAIIARGMTLSADALR
ncbi:substrate-binding domain-containing protein [Sphingomonas baiyangensis]|uniref:Phosphate ABC transporter substrate-binding protein n=1 Tax=Sphingomonas baiyangensis TaxID=2572576 RepID=A0A4U1L7E4_9SPHN|nr:substrate-binding domain-containing protein [Sphingomonas baiyangensis]TKD52156.1 phosphate ABC transporter substrate-binding protein [Sphingomonas baiyangensis]